MDYVDTIYYVILHMGSSVGLVFLGNYPVVWFKKGSHVDGDLR